MATATISGTTVKTISGGSSVDRVTLSDVVAAASSNLTSPFNNLARLTTVGVQEYIWNSAAYCDLTGATLILENSSNDQSIMFQLGGDCIVGLDEDGNPRNFTLHIGDSDIANTHTSGAAVIPFDFTDQIFCEEGSRFVVTNHLIHANSANTNEPGARNPLFIKNNNSGSQLRFTGYGGRMANDGAYSLASLTVAKPNGTMLWYWEVTSDVTVRDLEIYDGLVDWRPTGTWAPPTRGVFISDSWIKFLGTETFTYASPLIFGNELDEFKLVLNNSGEFTGNVWWQHGLRPATDVAGAIIYNNMSGVDWASDMAVFNGNTSGRNLHIEHHVTLQFKIIDQLGADILGADLKFTCRDPAYAASTTIADVTFPIGNEKVITATSISDGTGQIGNDNGDLSSDALCIEAFQKVGDNSGADVDGAYHSSGSARADYGSFVACTYSLYKWGKEVIYSVSYAPVLSGNVGDGVQAIGVLQMTNDLGVTAATIGAVGTGLASLTYSQLYDRVTKYCFDNDLQNLVSFMSGAADFGALDLVFDSSAGTDVGLSGNTLTIRLSAITSDSKFSGIVTAGDVTITDTEVVDSTVITASTVYLNGEQDITGATINGDLRLDTVLDSDLDFTGVIVSGLVYNDSASNTLQINASGSTLTAGDPGTGNGQTNLIVLSDLTLTNIVVGSQVLVIADTGGPATVDTVFYNETAVASTVIYTHTFVGNQNTKVKIRKGTSSPYYKSFETTTTLTVMDSDIAITQELDEN